MGALFSAFASILMQGLAAWAKGATKLQPKTAATVDKILGGTPGVGQALIDALTGVAVEAAGVGVNAAVSHVAVHAPAAASAATRSADVVTLADPLPFQASSEPAVFPA